MAQQKTIEYRCAAPVEIKAYPIKSAATFKIGDFVIFTSTGLDIAAASGANVAATSQYVRIVGRAITPAVDPNTNAIQASGWAEVLVAGPEVEFGLPLYHATPASAVPDVVNQLGVQYELRNASGGSGFWGVALDATTNKKVTITDYFPADYPGWPGIITAGTTQYARAWVKFIAASTLATGAR